VIELGGGMRVLLVLGGSLLVGGCAGQFLNENTLLMSPSIGTVEERQILANLAKFVSNPWAIPGHVELANGQIQITNQLGVNLKFPYSKVVNGSGAVTSKTIGSEADVNPAQTQDQESYNLLPVTDSEDLRRLRALYHYAVCPGDSRLFSLEWGLADQRFFRPPMSGAAKKPPAKKRTLAEVITKDLEDAKTAKLTPGETASVISSELAVSLTDVQKEGIKAIIESSSEVRTKTKEIIGVVGSDAPLKKEYAAPTPSKATQGKSDQTKAGGTGDSVAFEEYKKEVILSPEGLGTEPWLFLRNGDGTFSSACREAPFVGPQIAPYVYLGTAGGYEFWTNDRKKFSDLVLFVLGNIPNTVGSHVIGGGSKASNTQFFAINGQVGVVTPSKATAR
jgi:hypothetical protein